MKCYIICEKIDSLENDEYWHIDKAYANIEDAKKEVQKIAVNNLKTNLINAKKDIEKRLENLDKGIYYSGFTGCIDLSLKDNIVKNIEDADYGDFYIKEVKII